MLEITAKDWHINQTRIPPEGSEEYEAYFEYQKQLCLFGCTVDGVYITGYLYWHLNFWNTDVDFEDDRGYTQQIYTNPILRDNEWLIFNAIQQAEKEKKGLAIGGIRRASKSTFESSYLAHGATFDQDSQNIIAGLNSPDIKLVTDKIDKGLNKIPTAWQWQRIEDNWSKQVTLGFRDTKNKKYPFSQILIRNLDNGINQEAIAGTKPRKLIIDEAAKADFAKALQAAIPGFTTMYGWTCSPIITFTGGDASKFADAKELMFNPEAFNFLAFPHKDKPNVKHGLFLDATYRLEGKEESNLGAFLGKPESKELSSLRMLVSNPEKSLQITEDIIEQRRLSGDRDAYLKEKMYYPKEVEDIFISNATNVFNTEAIKQQILNIEEKNLKGHYVDLYHDGSIIRWKDSEKTPVSEYPVKKQSKDAPIVIWEHPIENPAFGLYVAGVDSYRIAGKSAHSESLGTVYIFKRTHTIVGEGYQEMLVASYAARPDDDETWNDQARLLIKYYNAYALVENDDMSFIDYMKNKKDADRYLAEEPGWLKQVAPFSTTGSRKFGVSRSADRVRSFLLTLSKHYLDERLNQELDEEGSIISETLGVSRIFDKMLLEELKVLEDGVNADRYVAFSLALGMANSLDPLMGPVRGTEKNPQDMLKGTKSRNSGRGMTKIKSKSLIKHKR